MKIVLVCNEYPPRPHGGIGTFVETMALGLSGRGHTVTVVVLAEADEQYTDRGVQIVTLRGSKIKYVGNLISRCRLRKWLSAYAQKEQIDIIEVPDYMGLLPFGVDHGEVVIRLHLSATAIDVFAGLRKGRGIEFYERRTLRMNSNWIGVSHYIMKLTKDIFGVYPEHSTVIYNPVAPSPQNLPTMPALPSNYLLYASALTQRKGAIIFAKAAGELLAKRTDLHLVYVGNITEEAGYPITEDILNIIGSELKERVHFLGYISREHVLACMSKARVFVFPSNLEAFGLVVVEAMDCGVPVVCSNCPPLPEIVEDAVTGLLADPTSPQDITEKITRILDDPAFAQVLVSNAKTMVAKRFSLENCLNETERFYKKCLKY
jgi:glycosyltransferase involved in cell wall biosynthesis